MARPKPPDGLTIVADIPLCGRPEGKEFCLQFTVEDNRGGITPQPKRMLYIFPEIDTRPWADKLRERLRRLAEADMPHVHQPMEVGRTSGGHLYVLARHFGEPLSKLLGKDGDSRYSGKNGQLGWEYFEQLARALESLHSHGLVHGDVRTDNILVDGGAISLSGVVTSWLPHWTEGVFIPKGYEAKIPNPPEPNQADDLIALGKTLEKLVPNPEGSTKQEIFDGLRGADGFKPFVTVKEVRAKLAEPTVLGVSPRLLLTMGAALVVVLLIIGLVSHGLMQKQIAIAKQAKDNAVAEKEDLIGKLNQAKGLAMELTKLTKERDEARGENLKLLKLVPALKDKLAKLAKLEKERKAKAEKDAEEKWKEYADNDEMTWDQMLKETALDPGIEEPVRQRLLQWCRDYDDHVKKADGRVKIWARYDANANRHTKAASDWWLDFFVNGNKKGGDTKWIPWDRINGLNGFEYWYVVQFHPGDALEIKFYVYGKFSNDRVDMPIKGPLPLWRLRDPQQIKYNEKPALEVYVTDFPGPAVKPIVRLPQPINGIQ